jgi:hypothetical protein
MSGTPSQMLTLNFNYVPTNNKFRTNKELQVIHKALYECLNYDFELFEWKMYVDYAAANSDFVYFHRANDQRMYYNLSGKILPCVESHFGKVQFCKWVYDTGEHLSIEGNQEVAKWIKASLKI